MAKLILNPSSPARQETLLPRTLLSIGRDPSNDIVLPDAMVSRRHAVIELRGSQYFLRDCNSSNGSLVNGDKVSERGLRDGDLVAIGSARLLFRDDVESLDAAGKVVQHPSSPRLHCASCGADYRRGDQFCRQCGGRLQSGSHGTVCPACGTVVALPARFCNACGGDLGESAGFAADSPVAPPEAPAPPAPVVESRAERVVPRPRGVSLSVGGAAPKVAPGRPRPEPVPAPRAARARPDQRPEPRPRREAAPLADIGTRVLAGLIDFGFVTFCQLLLLAPALYYWASLTVTADVSFLPILLSVLLLALSAALGGLYFVYFWAVRGRTPGKSLLGLAVEGEDGEYPIGIGRAVTRLLGYGVSAALLGVGFMLIALDGNALHDRIAGTRVVRREGS
jgi:uncharacterized RDD family membrane protein YckC